MLHDYQQQRICTLLDPGRDPLGTDHRGAETRLLVILVVDGLHHEVGDIDPGEVQQFEGPKLEALTNDQIAKYILYIDEVASFLEFTHDDTLDSNLTATTVLLNRFFFLKNAKTVIVSDAIVNDSVFEFLKHRASDKTVYLKNDYKK